MKDILYERCIKKEVRMNWKLFLMLFIVFSPITKASKKNKPVECVTIAILAKDKAHVLPLYLECLEAQTWPKNKTYLYIRTNNNNDGTAEILRDWVARVGKKYAKIYFDASDVEEQVQQYGQHEWNGIRFKVLGKIRQNSVDWAIKNRSHYFVIDCDNFICPDTLSCLMETHVPIVAPFLRCYDPERYFYSNYHAAIDENGYYKGSDVYYDILEQRIKGIIEVPVIHCTYFIRYEVLDTIYYDDESWRYEYVIFSDSARKQNISQYIDNRKTYGYISFAENKDELNKELCGSFLRS
jgi:Glycosyl transferase family 2